MNLGVFNEVHHPIAIINAGVSAMVIQMGLAKRDGNEHISRDIELLRSLRERLVQTTPAPHVRWAVVRCGCWCNPRQQRGEQNDPGGEANNNAKHSNLPFLSKLMVR